jgi:hypothetical protein
LLTAVATVDVVILRIVLNMAKAVITLAETPAAQALTAGSQIPPTEAAPTELATVRDPRTAVAAEGHVQIVYIIAAIDREALAITVEGYRLLAADHCTYSSSAEAGVGHHPLAVHDLRLDAGREAGAAVKGKESPGTVAEAAAVQILTVQMIQRVLIVLKI